MDAQARQLLRKLVADTVEEIVDARIDLALAGHRPRGNAPVTLMTGALGGTITASAVAPQLETPITYPCFWDEIYLHCYPAGSVTFDVWMQPPGLTFDLATSIFGGVLPAIVAGRENLITTMDPAWQRFIPPGSILYLYVTAAAVAQWATITLTVRAT